MKAIKLNKIEWNLSGLSESDKEKVTKLLPVEKGFMADDNFNVTEKVSVLLKKKYGYDVITFAFTECRVAENIEELLLLCVPKGKENKELFNNAGSLSAFGRKCKNALIGNIRYRHSLEARGTSPYDMPCILDEIMIGVEKVGKISWEGHTLEELMKPIKKEILNYRRELMKSAMEAEDECDECDDCDDYDDEEI